MNWLSFLFPKIAYANPMFYDFESFESYQESDKEKIKRLQKQNSELFDEVKTLEKKYATFKTRAFLLMCLVPISYKFGIRLRKI